MTLEAELRSLVDRIVRLIEEYERLVPGNYPPGGPRPPATIAQVEAVEKAFSIGLPDDFRRFLLMHNGWEGFDGEVDLLSTDQMLAGEVREWVEEVQEFEREYGNDFVAEGFVIEASETGTQIALYDRQTIRGDGGMDLVEWDSEEIDRHECFLVFLKEQAEVWQELVDKNRGRIRPKRK